MMPTLAETQLKELSAWIAASSKNSRSPMGDTIIRTPYAEFATVALDDPAPDLSAAVESGCLPLLVTHDVLEAEFEPSQGQPILTDRAAQLAWLSTAQRDGFPACRVVSVAQGNTLRQAAVAGGIDPDADRLIVGILQACF